jgi:hypothetical protein
VARGRGAATLRIEVFEPLVGGERAEVVEEGDRLLAFVAGGARARAVAFAAGE